MIDRLLTYLWVGIEYFSAIALFDAFSARKKKRVSHWLVVISFVILEATILNWRVIGSAANIIKIPLVLIFYYILQRILYNSNRIFCLYMAAIFYAVLCCAENLLVTFLFFVGSIIGNEMIGMSSWVTLFSYGFVMAICCVHKMLRKRKAVSSQKTKWTWYTVPAVISFISVVLTFFYGNCYLQGKVFALPLFVSSIFITAIQVGALFLISWMEENARFREESLSLQTKAKAQQESVEALSMAYAQQRKLTHDFRAHLSTLEGMLAQQSPDTGMVKDYIHTLQSEQTERLLLVNTHHAALDALLNQKARVAKNRKIDIQFCVNDLSAIAINIVDLTVVISNTLDNAIEACEKLPIPDRQIHVKLLLEEDEIFYAIRNRSLPVDMAANQPPATTKQDSAFHGYGLQNVQSILGKYHTLYAMNYENGWFEFATDFPNTLIS